MPSVTDYLNAQKTAIRSAETAKTKFMAAIVAAAETTKANPTDFDYQLDRLDDPAVRTRFHQTFINSVTNPYQAGITAMPGGDPHINRNLFMSGWFGFNEFDITKMVDKAKGRLSVDKFYEGLVETLSERTSRARFAHANSVMEQIPSADFLTQVGITGARNPNALTLDDRMELVREFEHSGAVGPKLYTGKPYM